MAVDLHLHSTMSDGSFTPTKVVEYAHSIGLKCMALTDHDTVKGIEEARARATSLRMPFIPGIEMTTLDGDMEVHVLGYFIDHKSQMLIDILSDPEKETDQIKLPTELIVRGSVQPPKTGPANPPRQPTL